MAYTRTWNTAYEQTPAGSDQRSTVDDRIRDFKQDMRERMETVFNWSIQDPITVKSTFSGITTGKVLMLAAGDFAAHSTSVPTTAAYVTQYTGDGGVRAGSTLVLHRGILLPATAIITNMIAYVYVPTTGNTGSTAGWSFYRQVWGTSGLSPIASVSPITFPTLGTLTQLSATTSLSLSDSYNYHIAVTLTIGVAGLTPNFYGMKITYDVPTALALR